MVQGTYLLALWIACFGGIYRLGGLELDSLVSADGMARSAPGGVLYNDADSAGVFEGEPLAKI